ncbi:aluminum-activated malate transporter 10-like [Canna indica]|uniref:Aluminum-activated malate transporter 10-like n=1 Tax=Canna indica TaxID=4628 RepID=A0AAQ3KN57_9LILI|nr:aluminum-activated malate transporter 10-like [Canna indica]
MANETEWQVTMPESSTQESKYSKWLWRTWTSFAQNGVRIWVWLLNFLQIMASKVADFVKKIGKVAEDDPRKVIHGIKVGIALTVVSLFYYARPLYDCVGGNSIWAVMTVVMVFEFTVGGCLYKGFNRAMATLCAAALAVGIHWIASKSGEELKPIILSASVFLLGSVATFSRFIPAVKARFEYGVIIFILTFSLVAVSGYRVDELLALAQQRASTVAIGICICVLVCILICPVWSGEGLHLLVSRNMEMIADSLEGMLLIELCAIKEGAATGNGSPSAKLQGYKCVLSAQASENSQANLAKWEPPHGHFGFRHPWSQYLKVGAAMRECACCMEALDGCTHSEPIQGPAYVKKNLGNACMRLGAGSSKVLKELAISLKSMRKSQKLGLLIEEMKDAVQEVRGALESFAVQLIVPPNSTSAEGATEEKQQSAVAAVSIKQLMETMPAITVASLLIEISERIDGVVEAVNTLADLACFESVDIEGKPPCLAESKSLEQDTMKATQEDNGISLCLVAEV